MTHEVTQADREAAEAWRRDYGRKASYQDLLHAFAAHRIATERRIVEWLRSPVGKGSEEGVDYADSFADQIEAGAHRNE